METFILYHKGKEKPVNQRTHYTAKGRHPFRKLISSCNSLSSILNYRNGSFHYVRRFIRVRYREHGYVVFRHYHRPESLKFLSDFVAQLPGVILSSRSTGTAGQHEVHIIASFQPCSLQIFLHHKWHTPCVCRANQHKRLAGDKIPGRFILYIIIKAYKLIAGNFSDFLRRKPTVACPRKIQNHFTPPIRATSSQEPQADPVRTRLYSSYALPAGRSSADSDDPPYLQAEADASGPPSPG